MNLKLLEKMPENFRFFEGKEIRTLLDLKTEDLWFVAKDVASILGYEKIDTRTKRVLSNTNKMLKHIEKEDILKIDKKIHLPNGGVSFDRNGKLTLVNESGIYSASFSSKKENAKDFKKWITKEVLPAIRKNGFYISETISPLQIGEMITEVKSIYEERKLFDLEYRDLREKIEETLENFGATKQQVNGIFATMFQNLHIANVRKTASQIVFDELKEQRREISIQSFNQLRKISKIYKKDFLVALNYLDENEIVRFRNYLRHVINETIFYMNSPFTTVTLQGIQRQISHSSANLALNMLDYGAKNFPRPLRAEIEKLYTLLTNGGSEKEIVEILETIKITHHNLEESLKK
jgi:prophage antirepressor-like protein